MATLDRPLTFRTRHGRFTVRHASLMPAVLRYVRTLDAVIERRECGANAKGGGGFQPGNTCGKGDGGGGGSSGGSKKSGRVHDATGLPMNDDGTVTVYHHTSSANAEKIKATGKLKSAGEPHVYVTTQPDANTGYGDTVVPIKVNPDDLELDDEFPGGRKDFKISVDRPGGEVKVALDDGEGKDKGGAPAGEASKAVKAWAEKKFDKPEHAKAFTGWFGDSKVVDEKGEPLVVYHGTGASFDEFKPSAKGMFGPGIYASADKGDYGPYSPYAGKDNAQVVPLYMSIKNPHYAIAGDIKTFDAPDGTDGTILIDKRTKKILWAVARNPTAVKSATGNKGTFDPKDPRITRSLLPESRECGANAEGGGGFQPGNTCGKGDGGGGGGEGSDNADSIGNDSGAVSHEQAQRVFRGASEKAISPDHGGTPEQKAERAEFKKRVVEETVSRVREQLSEDDVPESLLKAMRFDRPEYSEGAADGEQKRTALVRGMVDQWANTSGDSDPPAVGVQRAIAAELSREVPDLKDSELKHLGQYGRRPISSEEIVKARQIETLVGESKAVRAVVRAQYEATQQYFKEQGIKELTLHRGFHAPNLKESDDAEILMQPASSFSLNRRTAEMFANDMEYAFSGLVTVTVPVNRVFSTPATGFGCLPEQEVVVLGGKLRGKLRTGGKK